MIKNKKIVIIIIISILLIGILIYFLSNKKTDYKKLLENNSYDIVYTKTNTNQDKVPHININNKEINKINEEIDDLYEYYLIYSPDGFNYEYNVSNNILSIIITANVVQPESTHYDILYKSYNIDINNLKLLSDKEILDKYNISNDKLKYFLYNKFLNYYNDLISKNYFTKDECDFKCFLDSKNIEDLLNDNNFYIRNNHLELYKYFNIFTDYKEENYFNDQSFHFIIT